MQALFDEGALVRNGASEADQAAERIEDSADRAGRFSPRASTGCRPSQGPAADPRGDRAGISAGSDSRGRDRKSDDELNRMLDDLQLGEFIYEQPAVGDTEYIFKHALTQEVAYNSVLIERRQLLHERTGEAIEALFARFTRRSSGRARASLRPQRQSRQGGRVSGCAPASRR